MKTKAGVWFWLACLIFQAFATLSFSQTLHLPPRPPSAPTGSQFINIISPMSLTERENWIISQIQIGNVPSWLTNLVPITVTKTISGTPHTLTYYVAPDYMAIGSDQDYFLEPMTPLLAQRVADLLNCTLPTRKMVDYHYTNAVVHLNPSSIPPSSAMTTVPVFADHNTTVRVQRNATTNAHPFGTLVDGDKKDVIISTNIYGNPAPGRVVIYGWHYPNGSWIQPVYDGHEETYADYSHGIRMVQMAVTLDGSPDTVTNILTSPTLNSLLSDEGIISVPRYPHYATAPVITCQPRSQTANAGSTISLNVNAVGDAPLGYQWKINGTSIPGATNSILSLSNLQSTNAGAYTATISNMSGSATTIPAVVRVSTNAYPLLFSDNFDTDASANWNLFWGAGNNIPDYSIDWAYDYGATPYTFNGTTYIIPPAPNSSSGTTRGVRLTVNNNDATGAIAGVNVYPKNQSFSNNFALKFDMWIQYPGSAAGSGATGSTEFGIFGINHLGSQVNYASTNSNSSDGIWFAVDGEGGTNPDYRAYVGNSSSNPSLLSNTAGGLSSADNASGIYPTLFPASRFESIGAPGKNWTAGEVSQLNGVLTWKLDDTIIAQRTNTSPYTAGNIMIGFMDIFPSIANPASNAFVIFDNIRVENLSTNALTPPAIISQPQSQNVSANSTVTLSVTATGSAPLSYQWRLNASDIVDSTSSTLTLTNVQPTKAGDYYVIISNPVGSLISSAAHLTVTSGSFHFTSAGVSSNGWVLLIFTGSAGTQYVIEASTNLINWTPIVVLPGTNGPLPFIDTNTPNFSSRYYRAYLATTNLLTDLTLMPRAHR
jgi:Immunoglobulin domain